MGERYFACDSASGSAGGGLRFMARAFLPDRGPGGRVIGRVVPGTLSCGSEERKGPVGATELLVLTDDGRAQRALVDCAAMDEASSEVLSTLFVYGTLRSGEARSAAPWRARARFAGEALADGLLLDLGAYPGLVPGPGHVIGELYELDDPAEHLSQLDEVEDFLGYGVEGSLYRRSIVRARSGGVAPARRDPVESSAILAWTYVYVGSALGAPLIRSGDWKRRRG